VSNEVYKFVGIALAIIALAALLAFVTDMIWPEAAVP